jgi:amino acid transporter
MARNPIYPYTKHMNFISKPMLRYSTLVIGLIFSVTLTAHLLSTSTSDAEFWTELTSGSGLAFFLYLLPYGAYFLFSKAEKSIKRLSYETGAILLLGLILVISALMPKASVRPEDVAILDPSILLILLQLVIVAGFAGLRNQSR